MIVDSGLSQSWRDVVEKAGVELTVIEV